MEQSKNFKEQKSLFGGKKVRNYLMRNLWKFWYYQ